MTSAFLAILRRDLALAVRAGGGGELALVFFLTVVVLIPFALGPDLNLLSRIGPAILWLGALLATLIGLDRLFQAGHPDFDANLSAEIKIGHGRGCRLGIGVPDMLMIDHDVVDEQAVPIHRDGRSL